MDARPDTIERQRLTLSGADGNNLCADLFTPPHAARGTVLLVHGGGQTRHSWGSTARTLAARGWLALAYDQRGHGDSAWIADAAYGSEHYARDLVAVARQMAERGPHHHGVPVVVGASLGGIAGLLAAGELDTRALRALVLVDVTPGMKPEGVDRVLAFMGAHAEDGFAAPDEAADAISAYLPHRPRPRDLSGLAKNLRRRPDGRWRWHWDPRFLDSSRHGAEMDARLKAAAGRLTIPVLLVRGGESELVGEAEAEAFRELAPHAEIEDVRGARHMVAGDRNDVFADAVASFLARL